MHHHCPSPLSFLPPCRKSTAVNTAVNKPEALKWYTRTAEAEYADAQSRLDLLLE